MSKIEETTKKAKELIVKLKEFEDAEYFTGSTGDMFLELDGVTFTFDSECKLLETEMPL